MLQKFMVKYVDKKGRNRNIEVDATRALDVPGIITSALGKKSTVVEITGPDGKLYDKEGMIKVTKEDLKVPKAKELSTKMNFKAAGMKTSDAGDPDFVPPTEEEVIEHGEQALESFKAEKE